MTDFCVYLTRYAGNQIPKWYMGSSSTKRVENGYRGSVCSKKWKHLWKTELKQNPDLFKTRIISRHNTRKEALEQELFLQKRFDAVRSPKWINEGYAQVNGYMGRDVSGGNNPGYGKNNTHQWMENNPDAASERNQKCKMATSLYWQNITEEEYKKRCDSMRKKKSPFMFKDYDAFIEMQKHKSLRSKEKNATKIEYNGNIYLGWNDLLKETGVTKHLYNTYYRNGIEPLLRKGACGPLSESKKR